MSDQNKFQVGDTVTWTSQAGGKSKTKTGKIVRIVPVNTRPYDVMPEGYWVRAALYLHRPHESYLIQVGKSKRLYWPLVKYLEKAEPELSEHTCKCGHSIDHHFRTEHGDIEQCLLGHCDCDDYDPSPQPNGQSEQPENLQEP